MNILIFAAGLGTRLKPLTDTMPKALVTVKGKSLLSKLIEKIKRQNKESENLNIVINIHHFADQIIEHIEKNDAFGLNIQFSDERDMLLDTGGGLKKALTLFPDESPVLIHNVDILSNIDLPEFYNQLEGASTLLVNERETTRYLLFDDDNKLAGWINTATGQVKSPYPQFEPKKYHRYAFSGIQVVNPTILKPYLEQWEGKFSIIDFYLSICDKVDIFCDFRKDLQMIDVGKTDILNNLQNQDITSFE